MSQEDQQQTIEEDRNTSNEENQQDTTTGNEGWGSWFSSTIGNVVRTMNQSTNKIGEQIQKLVNTEEDEELTSTATNSNQSSSTNELDNTNNNETLEDGTVNDNGGEIDKNIFLKTEEKIEASVKIAEEKIKSFFGTIVHETQSFVDETQELKYVKNLASSFSQTVVQTLEEASKLLYDNDEDLEDSSIHIYVNFKELFIEFEGLKHLQQISKLSQQCNVNLTAFMENRTDEEREKIEKFLRELEEILLDSAQFSTKEVEEKKESFGYILKTNIGKEIIQLVTESKQASIAVYDNLEEILSGLSTKEESIQTALLMLEKGKAECYRSLAKISALATGHILILVQHLLENKTGLPDIWKNEEKTVDDSMITIASVLRDYLLFLYSQLIEISNEYIEALKKNIMIVSTKVLADDVTLRDRLEKRSIKLSTRLNIHADKALSVVISTDKDILKVIGYIGAQAIVNKSQ
ncbi:hypothetical protein ABK040_003344 [Willaertia magna]